MFWSCKLFIIFNWDKSSLKEKYVYWISDSKDEALSCEGAAAALTV